MNRKNRPATASLPDTSFSSSEVARLAHVSMRQWQWWDEKHVVSPRHQGHKRLYVPEEVLVVRRPARRIERTAVRVRYRDDTRRIERDRKIDVGAQVRHDPIARPRAEPS